MKQNKTHYLLGTVVLLSVLLSSCAKDYSLTELTAQEQSYNIQDDPVVKALSAIPGISNIELKYNDTRTDSAYFFSFTQPIDHYNPSLGTYQQQAALRFKGFDNHMVVYTHGYEMESDISSIRNTDMREQLNGNQLNIEHRYFGNSLPENQESLRFTYFNADQQAHDIHALCSALKPLFTGKWVSTGTSKDGITTALQAYYSDLYGWNDINAYVPFCAPFLTGTDNQDGTHSPADITPGTYQNNVCGAGYPAGSTEAIGFERLQKIPYYICTNKAVRDASIKAFYASEPKQYMQIIQQYESKSSHSTGNLEKDLTAFALYNFLEFLFVKFSYVPYLQWSYLVPDPELLASGQATSADFAAYEQFITMDNEALSDYLESRENISNYQQNGEHSDDYSYNYVYNPSQSTKEESLWDLLKNIRKNFSMPYYVQAYKELGIAACDLSVADGSYLTSKQAFDVTYDFTFTFPYQDFYPQDGGQLMKDFRKWCYTENTQPILFVYAKNDPWTGGAPDEAAFQQNKIIQMVVDPIAIHRDMFKHRQLYELSTEQTIIAFLDKYLK